MDKTNVFMFIKENKLSFLVIFFLVFIFSACTTSYKTLPEDKRHFFEINEVNANKTEIFLAAQQWFANTLGIGVRIFMHHLIRY